MTSVDLADFIRCNTMVLAPPLVPEIRLHLAAQSLPIWQKTEEELNISGLPPPYWAFAWAGGQAVARFVLDNPALVAGNTVLDLAAGSGLAGIAALKAGAKEVTGNDIDSCSGAAMALNGTINSVSLEVLLADMLSAPPPPVQVILVGDVFYEKTLAEQALDWLRECRAAGAEVLVGDPERSYFPKAAFQWIADYQVPVSRELEDAEIKHTSVWRLG